MAYDLEYCVDNNGIYSGKRFGKSDLTYRSRAASIEHNYKDSLLRKATTWSAFRESPENVCCSTYSGPALIINVMSMRVGFVRY